MYQITIQHATNLSRVPTDTNLRNWAQLALLSKVEDAELTIRIVDIAEMTELNETYRKKKGPTNVLSFPFETPKDITLDTTILGDIIICADVVNQEAHDQHKNVEAHWAHMVIHGVFHLLGYDHVKDKEAAIMEALETATMQQLGFSNPYELGDDIKHYD